jgi:hypothetical protein
VAVSTRVQGGVRIDSGRHDTHPAGPVARAGRAAMVLWLAFIALALTRAGFAFAASMWGWGFDLLRFVAPVAGWTLWALSALTLIPRVARLLYRPLAALGRAFDRSIAMTYALPATFAAGLAWVFPDRLHFVGDFLLRFGTADRALKPSALFPQALPLDVFLHYGIPRALDTGLHLDISIGARLIGALGCALLAVLSVAFARALGQRGAFAITTAAVVFFGGYLAMFTGYGKAIAEVSLLTVAVAVFGLKVIREGRGLLPLSLCVAVGLVLHRSTLGLVPALVLCAALAPRAKDPVIRWSRPQNWIAAGVPLVTLAIMLPRILGTFSTMDPVHFTPPEVVSRGGILPAMFAGPRPADLLNVVGLLSPLALALPFGLLALGRWGVHAREGALLASLALPWLAMLLLIHPPQGMFRDWDSFTAAAVSLSMMTAWLVSLAARGARGWAWLCVPAVLGAAAPSVQWLMHNTDRMRGLARVEMYLREPPLRSESERARTWDFLGIRYAQLERWERSAAAMSRAAAIAPNPRMLLQWALAEQSGGNDRGAQDVYRRLLAIAPEETRGWYGLAFVSWRMGDLVESRRAAEALLRLRPGDPQVLRILEQVRQAEAIRVGRAR